MGLAALCAALAWGVVGAPGDAPTNAEGAAAPTRRIVLIADGVEDAARARLAQTLADTGAVALPDDVVAPLRAELTAHGVDCLQEATDCLARLAVLAEADRAVRVWSIDGALDVLVVDATPRRARARLQLRDDDAGWRAALEAALALAFDDGPLAPALPGSPEGPGAHAGPHGAGASAPRVAPPASAPSQEGGFSARGVLGAVAIGAGAVGVLGAAALGALALASMDASNRAHFQDDALAHARDANQRLAFGGVALAIGLVAGGAGAALVALDLARDGDAPTPVEGQ